MHVRVDHAILAAHAVKIYQIDKYQRCLSNSFASSSVEGPGRLPLLALSPVAAAALGPVLPDAVDVLDEVALNAVLYLGELKLQAHFHQGVVLAYRVGDSGLHFESASGYACWENLGQSVIHLTFLVCCVVCFTKGEDCPGTEEILDLPKI